MQKTRFVETLADALLMCSSEQLIVKNLSAYTANWIVSILAQVMDRSDARAQFTTSLSQRLNALIYLLKEEWANLKRNVHSELT